jgi:hypothetical protein
METSVVVAIITGGFSMLVAAIHKLGKQNRIDHDDVSRSLGRIEGKVDAHLDDHRAGND